MESWRDQQRGVEGDSKTAGRIPHAACVIRHIGVVLGYIKMESQRDQQRGVEGDGKAALRSPHAGLLLQ